MIKSLEQYFIQFGHLDFPNVGSLKWYKKEANWQDGKLTAPVEEIVFDIQVKCHDGFVPNCSNELH